MKSCFRAAILAVCVLSFHYLSFAQETASPVDWTPLKFLIGDWIGEGGGVPGQSTGGGASFTYDLNKGVIVRRNHSEYPATKDRSAFSHDDLMIIYRNPSGKGFQAFYVDDGHTIEYKVEASTDNTTVSFVSDPTSSAPGFKLIYKQVSNDVMTVEFDIAPPGQPFAKYVDGTMRRKPSHR